MVTLQHRDVVSDDRKTIEFQLALESRLNRPLGFGEATGEEIASRKIAISQSKVEISRDFFSRCFDRRIVTAGPMSGYAAEQTNGDWVVPRGDTSETTIRVFDRPFPDFP